MSATEIINIIKAINDHVTVKYCDVILTYLDDKTNEHLKFEREFFNSMDKAVQKLINAIITALNVNASNSESYNEPSTNISLAQIQMHCDTYNRWKKTVYDDHLHTMQQMEKNCNEFVQKTLKQKLSEQHNLFDNALSIPLLHDTIDTHSNNVDMARNIDDIQNVKIQKIITPETIASNYNNDNDNDNDNGNDHIFNDNTTNSTIFSNDNFDQSPELSLNLTIPIFSTLNCNKNEDNEDSTIHNKRFMKQSTKRLKPKFVPVAPPKPPPPSTPYEEESNESSTCHQYQCIKCDKQFESQLLWLSHLKTHQKHTKSNKKRRKRVFSQIDFDSDQSSTNKTNKRRRHRFQCEYCDKRYFRSVPFIKHYNYHMKNNENNKCNFCGAQFQSAQNLQHHIYKYNAGLSTDNGYYQCCQCDMKFKDKLHLKSHLKRKHKRKQK